jgi:hypothetical protein
MLLLLLLLLLLLKVAAPMPLRDERAKDERAGVQ